MRVGIASAHCWKIYASLLVLLLSTINLISECSLIGAGCAINKIAVAAGVELFTQLKSSLSRRIHLCARVGIRKGCARELIAKRQSFNKWFFSFQLLENSEWEKIGSSLAYYFWKMVKIPGCRGERRQYRRWKSRLLGSARPRWARWRAPPWCCRPTNTSRAWWCPTPVRQIKSFYILYTLRQLITSPHFSNNNSISAICSTISHFQKWKEFNLDSTMC